MLTTPAAWVNPHTNEAWVFMTTGEGMVGYKVLADQSGATGLLQQWLRADGGTSPLVANGIVFVAANNRVTGYDALTGKVLWKSNQIGYVHWQSPIVANGVLYVCDQDGYLNTFALPTTN